MSVHIYTPRSFLGRRIAYCRSCRCRRRHTVRVYGWYDPEWTCNACGYRGIHRHTKRQRQRQAEGAREEWKQAGPLREAIEAAFANT